MLYRAWLRSCIITVNNEATFVVLLSGAGEAGRDNRNILDDSASQKLSREEIEEMRKKGETGEVGISSAGNPGIHNIISRT